MPAFSGGKGKQMIVYTVAQMVDEIGLLATALERQAATPLSAQSAAISARRAAILRAAIKTLKGEPQI